MTSSSSLNAALTDYKVSAQFYLAGNGNASKEKRREEKRKKILVFEVGLGQLLRTVAWRTEVLVTRSPDFNVKSRWKIYNPAG